MTCDECESKVKLLRSIDSGNLRLSCDCKGFYSQHLDALRHPGRFPDSWVEQ